VSYNPIFLSTINKIISKKDSQQQNNPPEYQFFNLHFNLKHLTHSYPFYILSKDRKLKIYKFAYHILQNSLLICRQLKVQEPSEIILFFRQFLYHQNNSLIFDWIKASFVLNFGKFFYNIIS